MQNLDAAETPHGELHSKTAERVLTWLRGGHAPELGSDPAVPVPSSIAIDDYDCRWARSREPGGALTTASPLALAAKSAIDLIGASTGLLLSVPLIALAAVAIKLDSPGPVFFNQVRCGRDGRPFRIRKLRTMVADAEERKDEVLDINAMDGPVFKSTDDPRVTRTGRLLRRTSIDELPQFWNVLVGDMSLVGPRPPLPSEVAQYQPYQRRRLLVKPGLTCDWQVSGRNQIDFSEWVRLDLDYIDRWSLRRDLRLILRTIPAVVRGHGAC